MGFSMRLPAVAPAIIGVCVAVSVASGDALAQQQTLERTLERNIKQRVDVQDDLVRRLALAEQAPRLSGELRALVADYKKSPAGSDPQARKAFLENAMRDGYDVTLRGEGDQARLFVRVEMRVRPQRSRRLSVSMRRMGATIAAQSGGFIEAVVPIDRLQRLSGHRDVRSIFRADDGVLDAVSDGVVDTDASIWHLHGVTGTGMTVAIIDDGFLGYDDVAGSDLPALADITVHTSNFPTFDECSDRTSHGRQVAEVVHDMAPNADLVLVCAGYTASFLTAVDWLLTNDFDGDGTTPDIDVIVQSPQHLPWTA